MSIPRAALAVLPLAILAALCPSCSPSRSEALLPRSQTWAELRVVRRGVTVTPPGEAARAPYPRERLVDGEAITVEAGGLGWLRRDGGATLLVRGPAKLVLRADTVEIEAGRVFIDTPESGTTSLVTPGGSLHLAHVRASLDAAPGGATDAYVLAGEVRVDGSAERAVVGEVLHVAARAAGAAPVVTTAPALAWEDWTGGLATTDRSAEPAPYGVGTVGARSPGEQGVPRFPLAIHKLDVKVTIDHDFAVTEVDEIFFNPSSETVEGIYRFRTPDGATLHRFGVDRGGVIVWGHAKEKQAAAAQYQANVYAGSKEDPALLEWDAPGVYRARLYPIGPGESRRVVVRYAEWLGRTGEKGERRLYTYPMAAEGPDGTLPVIEELRVRFDLEKAGASDVRVGMTGVREGNTVIVSEHDLVPRADLAIELFDGGASGVAGYRAGHALALDTLPPQERAAAIQKSAAEADYVLVRLRPGDIPAPMGGLDLAVIVDTSAATDPASLAIARSATAALLAHLGDNDRAVVWAGDTGLRPIVADHPGFAAVSDVARRRILAGLAGAPRGGATDLGAMLSEAAAALDPMRRSAIVYIGDGAPTVGETSLGDLRARLAKLPRPVRIFSLGVGDGADLGVLKGLSRGALAERIGDGNAAARAALRILEQAERPALLGASIDLGASVERVFPRDLGAIVEGESLLVVGRVAVGQPSPTSVTVTGPSGAPLTARFAVSPIDDRGDLSQRWADGRLSQLLDEGAGRAAMIDLGLRHGIVTPFTSFYVPTKNEMSAEERAELDRRRDDSKRAKKSADASDTRKAAPPKEPSVEETSAAAAAAPNEDPHVAHAQALRDASEFGMIGLLNSGAGGDPNAPTAPWGRDDAAAKEALGNDPLSARGNQWGADIGDSFGAGGLGFSGVGEGGGGRGEGIGLGSIGTLGHGAGTGSGQGFGSGHGRLGGNHKGKPAQVRMGAYAVTGRLPPEVIQRIVRQNFGRFRLCYEKGLRSNPNLMGRVSVRFAIGADGAVGAVSNAGSDLPDGNVIQCVVRSFPSLSFPQPDGGVVSVIAPMVFTPGDSGGIDVEDPALPRPPPAPIAVSKQAAPALAKTAEVAKTQVTVIVDEVPHQARRCGDAAAVPFEDRIALWRERLVRYQSNPSSVASMYQKALAACEAPTWRERSRLIALMLDALVPIQDKVALWRALFEDVSAADAIYRGILARVRTSDDLRKLHDALGLKSMDAGELAKVIKTATSSEDRATKLRVLAKAWPDDFTLAMRLLDALEDTGDDAGARSLGRSLRARPDADAALRTAVGELYLRLGARGKDAAQKAGDEAEARRAFGEIVEFSPDDPVARRRLGDLLRAHGWFEDATRQYETLARLAPDDVRVALLLAAAAEGQGKLESAVKWSEKAGAEGDPGQIGSPASTARAFAATYLAWGRLEATTQSRPDEARTITARLVRVLSTETRRNARGARVSLTWSHPELHPTLWSNALGAPMPAPEGDVTLGIAAVVVPARDGVVVEVRLSPDEVEHAARLGAQAVLTAAFTDEGEPGKVVRLPVVFAAGSSGVTRFSVEKGAVRAL
jgi:Ca-activated chloride channel family protein